MASLVPVMQDSRVYFLGAQAAALFNQSPTVFYNQLATSYGGRCVTFANSVTLRLLKHAKLVHTSYRRVVLVESRAVEAYSRARQWKRWQDLVECCFWQLVTQPSVSLHSFY